MENYPGFVELSGNELADKLIEQTIAQGAMIELDEVTSIEGQGGDFTVNCIGGVYKARAVIIATGSHHRKLGIEGEERLTGEGVSYCAVCDGAFFRGKSVAVIGGGNSALVDAVLLSESCERVYVVQNLAYLTGEERLGQILMTRQNVEIIYSSVVKKLIGADELRGIETQNTESGEQRHLAVSGMFVAIGQVPQNKPFESIIELDKWGYAISGENCVPNAKSEGIFVAGDCRTKTVRQVTTATADGAVAALAACNYLDSIK